jgi:hypothetical protein
MAQGNSGDYERTRQAILKYHLSLSTQQRFETMERDMRCTPKTLIRLGLRKPSEIAERPCR